MELHAILSSLHPLDSARWFVKRHGGLVTGVHNAPELHFVRVHLHDRSVLPVYENQLGTLPCEGAAQKIEHGSVLLQHQNLLFLNEGVQLIVVIALNYQRAGHAIKQVQCGRSMLVTMVPVRSWRLAHAVRLTIPFGNVETVGECAYVILRQMLLCHGFNVLRPQLLVRWQSALPTPYRGLVIRCEKLFLPSLPRWRPVAPLHRLLALSTCLEYLIEYRLHRLFVHERFAVASSRRGTNR